MFSWMLKIIPKLDESQLRNMERTLSSRFMRVAKGFGKGLIGVLKGGGIAGVAMALIDKLLNPLQAVQEAIDRTLKSSDDIVTNAKQFDSTPGKLAKAIALGQSTGLDQDSLFMMINKFQNAVAEAKQNPNKPSAVENFTSNPDMVENFMQFVDELRKMETSNRILAEQAVFGEKNILKMADFVQTDHTKQAMKLGLNKIPTKDLTKDLTHLGGVADLTDELTAARNLFDLHKKAQVINEGMARARNVSEKLALSRENQNISNYKNLAAISDMMGKIAGKLEDLYGLISGFVAKAGPGLQTILDWLTANSFNKLVKFLFSRGGR